jgi:hypothetical protein
MLKSCTKTVDHTLRIVKNIFYTVIISSMSMRVSIGVKITHIMNNVRMDRAARFAENLISSARPCSPISMRGLVMSCTCQQKPLTGTFSFRKKGVCPVGVISKSSDGRRSAPFFKNLVDKKAFSLLVREGLFRYFVTPPPLRARPILPSVGRVRSSRSGVRSFSWRRVRDR